MTNITRRDALQTLGLLSAFGVSLFTIGCCQSPTPQKHNLRTISDSTPLRCSGLAGPGNEGLNILLHGMFLLQLDTTPINLFSPIVNGHVYGAINGLSERIFKRSHSYSISGINDAATALTPDAQHEFVFSRSAYPNNHFLPKGGFFDSFTIPVPSQFPSRLRVQGKPKKDDFFNKPTSGVDDYGMRPLSIPFVYVFTYFRSQFAAGTLTNASLNEDGQPIWNFNPSQGDPSSYDLHLYAEPIFNDPNHLPDAIAGINNMFNPSLLLSVTAAAQNSHTDPQCDEETDLLDLLHTSGSRAGEMANCMSFVLGA